MLSIIINEPQNELLQFSAYSGLVFLAFFNVNIIVMHCVTLFNAMVLTNGKKLRSPEVTLGLTGTNSLAALRRLAVFTLHYHLSSAT